MSYIREVLQPGETVRYVGTLHWVVYGWAILFLLLAIIAAVLLGPHGWDLGVGRGIVAGVFLAIALLLAIHAWWRRWTTEVAVTNLRVIYATGFISRKSVEVHMDKIESVDVDQSILGRILNYGTVTIRGTGTTFEPLSLVERPLEFRNQVTAS